ncbi:Inosine-uridine nucleoside N-ribohydrolase [Rathayibacter oskolensis]|uniref:Inosine-uridine nucleoside N-ribohydrolase n=1 Tax=Rathayibacter oskolensis TaxID=1891671 RepID=A0A1X7NWF8_9MICO|nr:nucleoside hydrolase [Rathayibacter oskolensis]SMH42662.1 Inosine-uridine nucleoside N-ribohydrolase [Rathayibacter oskolensis]
MTPPPPHRLIVSTDAANEADDQFAIVQALLSATLDIRGLVAAHFGREGSAEQSRREIDRLVALVGAGAPVADGSAVALSDERTPSPSEGSRLIVEEALRDEGRLWIAVLGPLTDVASALLEEPAIASHDVVVVWVGGPPYDEIPSYQPEFNLINDVAAADVVMASGVDVWQIPMPVYSMVGVGHAELRTRLRGTSPLADYLVDQLIAFNDTISYGPLDFRSLGDSPAIGAVMNPAGGRWRSRPAPRFSSNGDLEPGVGPHSIRVCEAFDTRWLIEDLFAKLLEFGAETTPPGSGV